MKALRLLHGSIAKPRTKVLLFNEICKSFVYIPLEKSNKPTKVSKTK